MSDLANLFKRARQPFAQEGFSCGIDIGTSAIKAVKLKFTKQSVELAGTYLEPASSEQLLPLKKISQSLNSKKANISLSGPSTIIRYAEMPKMNADELKLALRFEAQKHIPFAISDVYLDSYILKRDLTDNKMYVLIAAAKKDFVNERLKLLEAGSLRPWLVDIDSLALINAFNFNYSEEAALASKAAALLNIGAATSNLNILENALPRLSRDINIAGNSITQKIKDDFGLEFSEAEKKKLEPGSDKEKTVQAAEAVLANLAVEIRASFDYFETQGSSSVAKIYLSGAGSSYCSFKDILANILGMEVECWDPLKRIVVAQAMEGIKEKEKLFIGQFAVALGLALRR